MLQTVQYRLAVYPKKKLRIGEACLPAHPITAEVHAEAIPGRECMRLPLSGQFIPTLSCRLSGWTALACA